MFMCPHSTDPPADETDPLHPFTAAQERIADLLGDGCAVPVIALRLKSSHHTICAHIRAMALVLPGDAPAQEKIRAFVAKRRRLAS